MFVKLQKIKIASVIIRGYFYNFAILTQIVEWKITQFTVVLNRICTEVDVRRC